MSTSFQQNETTLFNALDVQIGKSVHESAQKKKYTTYIRKLVK